MSPRRHITLKTKLASALLALRDVPYIDAKQMSEDQVISLYQFDHGILHAIEPNDLFWNLTPTLIAPHRRKSADDKGIVSKSNRVVRGVAAHQARMVAKRQGEPKPASRWVKGRKIASRGFRA